MARLRVKEVAEAKGFTMTSLSYESRISFNTIKKMFRDDSKYSPSLATLEIIAKALKVPISDLYEEDRPEDQS